MKTPQQILNEQEPKLFLMEMAKDRFACGSWPADYDCLFPSTPGDFLAWIEDEVQVQLGVIPDSCGRELTDRANFVTNMAEVAAALHTCGVIPAIDRLPWNYKKNCDAEVIAKQA